MLTIGIKTWASGSLRKFLTLVVEDDSDDKAVDTEDTRHDNGHDGLEDEVGLEDTHAADSDARLGSSVCSTEV